MDTPSGIHGHKRTPRHRRVNLTPLAKACELVKGHLEGKVVRSTELEAWARQMGISGDTLQDARRDVPVKATKVRWVWYCSLHELTEEERAKIKGRDASPPLPADLTITFRQNVPAGTYVLTPRASSASSAVAAPAEHAPPEGGSGEVLVCPGNTQIHK